MQSLLLAWGFDLGPGTDWQLVDQVWLLDHVMVVLHCSLASAHQTLHYPAPATFITSVSSRLIRRHVLQIARVSHVSMASMQNGRLSI